jgi:hypothetical protein
MRMIERSVLGMRLALTPGLIARCLFIPSVRPKPVEHQRPARVSAIETEKAKFDRIQPGTWAGGITKWHQAPKRCQHHQRNDIPKHVHHKR